MKKTIKSVVINSLWILMLVGMFMNFGKACDNYWTGELDKAWTRVFSNIVPPVAAVFGIIPTKDFDILYDEYGRY